jgi:hypothetical protein
MANLSSDQDSGATEPIDAELPDPNPHEQVHVHSSHPDHDVLVGQMKAHLAEHTRHLAAPASYHGGQMPQKGAAGVTGQSSQRCVRPWRRVWWRGLPDVVECGFGRRCGQRRP